MATPFVLSCSKDQRLVSSQPVRVSLHVFSSKTPDSAQDITLQDSPKHLDGFVDLSAPARLSYEIEKSIWLMASRPCFRARANMAHLSQTALSFLLPQEAIPNDS